MAKVDWKVLVFIIGIFILGFGVRCYNLEKLTFIEPDSYWFARHIMYEIEGKGYTYEPLSYYPYRQEHYNSRFSDIPLPYVFPAYLYKIFFGNEVNKDKLCLLLEWLTPVIANLGIIILYFCLREIFKDELFCAIAVLTACLIPAFVHRTMSGFYEDDCTYSIFYTINIYLLCKLMASKFPKNIHLILLFIFTNILGWLFWKGIILLTYIYIFAIGLYLAKSILFDKKLQLEPLIYPLLGALIFCTVPTILYVFLKIGVPLNPISMFSWHIKAVTGNIDNIYSQLILEEIGEEALEYKRFFYEWPHKYVGLFVFSILGAILFFLNETREKMPFLAWWLGTFLMAAYKLKLTYYFGIPCALFAVYFAWRFDKIKELKLLSKYKLPIFLFILGLSLGSGGIHTYFKYAPEVEEFKKMFEHISKFNISNLGLSWGLGNYATFYGNLKVINDNSNHFIEIGNKAYYSLLAALDKNDVNKIIKEFKLSHILVSPNDLYSLPHYGEWYLKLQGIYGIGLYSYYVGRCNHLVLPGQTVIENLATGYREVKPYVIYNLDNNYITFDECAKKNNLLICYKTMEELYKKYNQTFLERKAIILALLDKEVELIKKYSNIDIEKEKRLPVFKYGNLCLFPLAKQSFLWNVFLTKEDLCKDDCIVGGTKYFLFKIN